MLRREEKEDAKQRSPRRARTLHVRCRRARKTRSVECRSRDIREGSSRSGGAKCAMDESTGWDCDERREMLGPKRVAKGTIGMNWLVVQQRQWPWTGVSGGRAWDRNKTSYLQVQDAVVAQDRTRARGVADGLQCDGPRVRAHCMERPSAVGRRPSASSVLITCGVDWRRLAERLWEGRVSRSVPARAASGRPRAAAGSTSCSLAKSVAVRADSGSAASASAGGERTRTGRGRPSDTGRG